MVAGIQASLWRMEIKFVKILQLNTIKIERRVGRRDHSAMIQLTTPIGETIIKCKYNGDILK